MLANLQMQIETENKMFMPFQKATILQSILMNEIDPEYAKQLHETGLHPYSQFVINQKGKNIWNISAQNELAYNKIIKPLSRDEFNRFYIEYDKCEAIITNKKVNIITKADFLDKYYFSDAGKIIKVAFKTPTAFKRQGRYVFMPELELIYQSLMNKYDAAIQDETLKGEELLEQLIQYSEIVDYNIESSYYSMNGVSIPAFVGSLTIKIKGSQQMANFIHMLFRFGEYSGVGIKTAIGMGGIRVIERTK